MSEEIGHALITVVECFEATGSIPDIFDTLKHIFSKVVSVAWIVVFRPSGRFPNICRASQFF